MEQDIRQAIVRNIRWLSSKCYRRMFRISPWFAVEMAVFIIGMACIDCMRAVFCKPVEDRT